MVTKAADRPESDCVALAEHMCHSAAMARRFYDASQRRKQKSASYVVSTDIIHARQPAAATEKQGSTSQGKQPMARRDSPAAVRRRYTEGEEELIAAHFADDITAGKPPVALVARNFLQCYPNAFEGHTPKDIIDKVRTFIRAAAPPKKSAAAPKESPEKS